MPKKYPVELVQPPGKHNPKTECVVSDSIKEYLKLPYSHLNPVQSEFAVYLEDDNTNVVVAAPTSSGKTLCAELFASRTMKTGRRLLYIAPMKALSDEKFFEWTDPSHYFYGKKIEILTGDFQFTEKKKKLLQEADIIFLTPEMFNSKCRYYKLNEWLHNCNIVIDEAHLMGSTERGDKLEIALIQYYENDSKTRSLLISATIPNASDFVDFLNHNSKNDCVLIKSDYRPCKLNLNFVPFNYKTSGRSFYEERENARMEKVIDYIRKFKDEPMIVFFGSKEFGRKLSEKLNAYCIKHEFHNADKKREERNKIEKDFRDCKFNVLLATSTVAWGCNSPARRVLLAHTSYGMTEMDPADIHQAIGRAGRLGYADEGDAYIFVAKNEMAKEQGRIFGGYKVKSCLNDLNTMVFHILSYIDQGHIKNAQELYDWHSRTLASIQKDKTGLEHFTVDSAQNVLEKLESRLMIKKNEKGEYETTEMGQITSRMYMSPLDVGNWFNNFSRVLSLNPPSGASPRRQELTDMSVALAFARCYTWMGPSSYISNAEQRTRTVSDFVDKMKRDNIPDAENWIKKSHVKYAAILYSMLNGEEVDRVLYSAKYNIQQDIDRMISTMKQIDARYGVYFKNGGKCKGYGWTKEWDYLGYRFKYAGIPSYLWELVSIKGIGQVYANKLYNAGVKTKDDFANKANHSVVSTIMGNSRAKELFENLELEYDAPKKKKKATKKKVAKKTASKRKVKSGQGLF